MSLASVPAADARSLPLDYLRGFVTLLVLAHHALLAYHPYAPPAPQRLDAGSTVWAAFPIVDSAHWTGVDIFTGFNDTFFMSLMFFLSGLFAWNSLRRKGAGAFVRDRLLRLGVPFLVAAGVLAPLAYYPTYLATGANDGMAGYWRQWSALDFWPAGPAWFLWLLLAFGCIAAGSFKVSAAWAEMLGEKLSGAGRRPWIFFMLLLALSALAYLPLAHAVGPVRWSCGGPFCVQTSRVVHYAVYFFIAACIGAYGVRRGLLADDGRLARRWPLWSVASLLGFGVAVIAFLVVLAAYQSGGPSPAVETFGNFGFVLSCAASTFAFLAIFMRFATKPLRVFDSLSRNAYGMYLTHYVFVTWLQYFMLHMDLPGAAKGILVLSGTVALSWSATSLLRRIPIVNRVI